MVVIVPVYSIQQDWSPVDQGLLKTDENGVDYFAFGGDFGDEINDENFCINGILSSDRRPKPAMIEVKRVCQPVEISLRDARRLIFEVKNWYHFKDLSHLDILWKIEEDGIPIQEGKVAPMSTTPGEVERLYIKADPVHGTSPGAEYFISVSFELNTPQSWAKAGHEIASAQFELTAASVIPAKKESPSGSAPGVSESDNELVVSGDDFQLVIDKSTGYISSYEYQNKRLIDGLLEPNFWRAQNDNDRRGWETHIRLAYWKEAAAGAELSSLKIAENQESVVIRTVSTLPEGKAEVSLEYEVFTNGWVRIRSGFTPSSTLPILPRFGLKTTIPDAYSSITYFGKGPHENYIDRQQSADVGLYAGEVGTFGEPYVYPQEHANRIGVRWISFRDQSGSGLVVVGDQPLSVSAWPYSQEALDQARHTNELPDEEINTVNIDLIQMGLGGNDSWSLKAKPLPAYQIQPEPMNYSFWIKPLDGDQLDPATVARTRIL